MELVPRKEFNEFIWPKAFLSILFERRNYSMNAIFESEWSKDFFLTSVSGKYSETEF